MEPLQILKDSVMNKIYYFRGEKVILDFDLALLYEVTTKVLKQSVRRNIERFPVDFMFELSAKEFANLRSQIVTSSWGGSVTGPWLLPNKALQCFRVSLTARVQLKPILRSCGLLSP